MSKNDLVVQHRKPPNILWIQTDEQRADSLSCYGHAYAPYARVRTPHLDALAQRGTLFANHHVQSPVCVPSRVCELTSRYAHQTGILNNSVHYTWGHWPEGMIAGWYQSGMWPKCNFLIQCGALHKPRPIKAYRHKLTLAGLFVKSSKVSDTWVDCRIFTSASGRNRAVPASN